VPVPFDRAAAGVRKVARTSSERLPLSLPSVRMTVQRSHSNAQVGQQLYAVVESVKKPEALWARLATGNYDWLGVRRNGRYAVGRPRLIPVREDEDRPEPDALRDRHRIEYLAPLDRIPRWESHPTVDEARDAYERVVTGDPVTPLQTSGVWKVRLVLDDRKVEELLVVRALPRMV
jgi:hypothetical protein